MKAEELRIGNYVTLGKNLIEQIWKIEFERGKGLMPNGYELELFNPIPLTPEWLEKFGFEKDKEAGYNMPIPVLHKRLVVPLCDNNEVRIAMHYWNGIITIAKDIKYVHQLQNLYYALTSTELKTK